MWNKLEENQTFCHQEHFHHENTRILMRVDMVLQYELYSEIHRHFFVTGLLNLWMPQAVIGGLNWQRKGGNVHAILLIKVKEKWNASSRTTKIFQKRQPLFWPTKHVVCEKKSQTTSETFSGYHESGSQWISCGLIIQHLSIGSSFGLFWQLILVLWVGFVLGFLLF